MPTKRIITLAAALILGSTGLTGAAAAAPAKAAKACTQNLSTGAVACYETRDEALAAAGLSATDGDQPTATTAALGCCYWVGTLYDYGNLSTSGGTIDLFADTPCGAGWGNLPSFNDRTSSLRVASGCGVTLYVNTNRGGSSYYFTGIWNAVPSWINNAASSVATS